MITYVTGNLFQSPAQVLVNAVNTVGVMGKGVALEFKQIFPDMYRQYRDLCEAGNFKIGMLWLYRSPNKWVLNFPTKQHWRNPSHVEYITEGLSKFVQTYEEMGIHSIALPPLGCGNGQLDFESQVRPVMEDYLSNLPIDIFIHPNLSDPYTILEHENPEDMREWLRSEPSSLPFTEVWDDLRKLLADHQTFETLANGNSFNAQIREKPLGLEINAAKQRRIISYEDLLAFWQQLRTHGFSMRSIAPGMDRELSYLTPIFAALPYIKPVRVADNYAKLRQSPITGLQILPTAFSQSDEPVQLSLFEQPLFTE